MVRGIVWVQGFRVGLRLWVKAFRVGTGLWELEGSTCSRVRVSLGWLRLYGSMSELGFRDFSGLRSSTQVCMFACIHTCIPVLFLCMHELCIYAWL